MPKLSSLQQKRSAEMVVLSSMPSELGSRDYVTGEMWKNKIPFRLALSMAASDEIAWHCKHYNGHKITKFYESGTALSQDMRVPVSKMEESLEASLKTAENPDGGPYSTLTREVSHGMKPLARRAQGRSSTTTSSREPTSRDSSTMLQLSLQWSITSWAVWKLIKLSSVWCGFQARLERLQEVRILCWIAWFTPAWQAQQVPSTCWAIVWRSRLSRRLLVEARMRGQKRGQASLGGNSLLDRVVYARAAGATCAKYVWGDSVKVTSLAALAGGGKGEGSKKWPDHRC